VENPLPGIFSDENPLPGIFSDENPLPGIFFDDGGLLPGIFSDENPLPGIPWQDGEKPIPTLEPDREPGGAAPALALPGELLQVSLGWEIQQSAQLVYLHDEVSLFPTATLWGGGGGDSQINGIILVTNPPAKRVKGGMNS
jgi:hypothetical protein